ARAPGERGERSREPCRQHRRHEDDADPARHSVIVTGVPAGVAANSRLSTRFCTRMQPFEAARPIDHGSFVPWIATGPPCAQFRRTFEYAEMPSAPGPYGPDVFAGISRWLT